MRLKIRDITDIAPVGLINLGATCYFNAFVQSLFHNVPLRNAILNILVKTNSKSNQIDSVIRALQEAFEHMQNGIEKAFSLVKLTGNLLKVHVLFIKSKLHSFI